MSAEIRSVGEGLQRAASYLDMAQSDGVLLWTVAATRTLVQLLERGDRTDAASADLAAVRAALAAIEPAVCASAEPLTPEHVAAGLGHVRGVLDLFHRSADELIPSSSSAATAAATIAGVMVATRSAGASRASRAASATVCPAARTSSRHNSAICHGAAPSRHTPDQCLSTPRLTCFGQGDDPSASLTGR